jgi:hypothetical protein
VRRRRRRDGRRESLARRQEPERVDVPVRVRRDPDAEVDVRLRVLRVARWADQPDRRPLLEQCVRLDGDRAQVDEGDGVAARGPHGDGAAAARDGAGEADDATDRRAHLRARRAGDVDAAVLSPGVGVVSEHERS